MASYLTTASVGEFPVRSYRHRGISLIDAVDPDLYGPTGTPRTGSQFAIAQVGEPAYKRLARTIAVPAGGATLSFWIKRDTEANWDHVFVEAHTVGADDWTTLPDLNGHTSADTGFSCPSWLGLHPFLEHYQADNGDGTCSPAGSSGVWRARSGSSDGYEQWRVDLGAYAGKTVEVSISYASDEVFQFSGAFVDDIVVSTGAGTTSFEADENTFDGWTVPGAPAGSPPNPNDWIVGTAANTPPPLGVNIDASLARQAEILDFEEDVFGPYPFGAAGGIVDDTDAISFALENQTRPIYAKGFFSEPLQGDSVVVHELAHQWYSDSLAVAQWQHIWLNEGFATYAEWLWSEREGLGTAQETFDFFYNVIPPDDPFWSLVIGDPGPDHLFDFPRLRERRDDAAPAASRRRGRRLLPDPPHVGAVAPRRERHHRPVHRAGGADLPSGAGRPLRDMAVHARASQLVTATATAAPTPATHGSADRTAQLEAVLLRADARR